MANEHLSIREVVEPIVGGYWGESVEPGSGNARVVRNGDILESGEIGLKVPERRLSKKEIQKAKLKNGDILITMSGNVGRVALVKKQISQDNNPFVASNFVKILRTKGNIQPEFLFFFLKSLSFQSELKKHTRGVAIQNLSSKVFDQKVIPIVPLDKQKKVVAFLEKVESLKKKRANADSKMEELILALFVRMFGDSSTWKSRWSLVTFGQVSSFITSGSRGWAKYYSDKGAQFIRVQNLAGHRLDLDDTAFVNPPNTAEADRTRIEPNDLLLAITGNTIGLSALAPRNIEKSYVSQHVAIIRPNDRVCPKYFSAFTALEIGAQKQIKESNYGQTKPALSLEQVRKLQLPLPPKSLQEKFVERVKEIETQIEKQKQSADQLDALFASLLSQVFINKP